MKGETRKDETRKLKNGEDERRNSYIRNTDNLVSTVYLLTRFMFMVKNIKAILPTPSLTHEAHPEISRDTNCYPWT